MTLVGARTFNSAWYQGRYMFPAVASIAVLLALGVTRVTEVSFPRRFVPVASVSLALAMAVIAAVAPFWWIAPAYAPRRERHDAAGAARQGVAVTVVVGLMRAARSAR